tara:strand:- start:206 stop:397 length:192 start_codon:yes stop_codon:yes gene_type:complete
MSQEKEVPHKTLVEWRSTGFISSEEIAFRSGDLIVAENVITKARRIISPTITESSSNKRVLKG